MNESEIEKYLTENLKVKISDEFYEDQTHFYVELWLKNKLISKDSFIPRN